MKQNNNKHSKALQHHIFVCCGSSCRKAGSEDIAKLFEHIIKDLGLQEQVALSTTHCNDCCAHSPLVMVYPEGIWYKSVGKKTARRIIVEHVLQNQPVEDRILRKLEPKNEASANHQVQR